MMWYVVVFVGLFATDLLILGKIHNTIIWKYSTLTAVFTTLENFILLIINVFSVTHKLYIYGTHNVDSKTYCYG